jgi:hypothetical protein
MPKIIMPSFQNQDVMSVDCDTFIQLFGHPSGPSRPPHPAFLLGLLKTANCETRPMWLDKRMIHPLTFPQGQGKLPNSLIGSFFSTREARMRRGQPNSANVSGLRAV